LARDQDPARELLVGFAGPCRSFICNGGPKIASVTDATVPAILSQWIADKLLAFSEREHSTYSTDNAVAARAGRSGWAELALGIGGFGIGTGEFVMMGLLPNVAADLGISVPTAGHLISAYALGVVVGAPLIAVLAARWPRHVLLLALMVFFGLGNFASALTPGYASLIAVRFLAGLPHGAYFGVASLVAASLVPTNERARAIGRMMLGLTGATLAGVPLATWIGQTLGWRAAYVVVGAIGVLTSVLIARYVPRSGPVKGASPARELSALGRKQVWLTLGVGSVGFGGLFCVYSYIAPTLTQVAGLPGRCVPFVLAVFGVGMILGNLVGSWRAALLRPGTGAVHGHDHGRARLCRSS
jgi:DHA1 family inner membrane transport protein